MCKCYTIPDFPVQVMRKFWKSFLKFLKDVDEDSVSYWFQVCYTRTSLKGIRYFAFASQIDEQWLSELVSCIRMIATTQDYIIESLFVNTPHVLGMENW